LIHFFDRCRQFLQKAAEELRKRYDMDDKYLSKLSMLTAKNASSLNFREHNPSLQPLVTLFPRIVNETDYELIQKIDN